MCCKEHGVKGSEVFVGGLARNITESRIHEVRHLFIRRCSFRLSLGAWDLVTKRS